MASILLQGLIGISYFTLALLLYYTRLRAIANDDLLEYATINYVLLTVSIFIFRYFFIHRELASLYYFIYPIICFSVYCWGYKRYTLLNEKIEVI